ncbi:MAG: hypothetical protein ABW250_05480 [Pyrinomonadaceae bacterium]
MSEDYVKCAKTCAAGVFAALVVVMACAAPSGAQQVPVHVKNLKRAEREVWRGQLAWPDRCEKEFEAAYPEREDYSGLEFHRLGRGLQLVEVTCDGGGIQPASVFILYDERFPRAARPLKLKGFETADESGNPLPYSEVRALTKFVARTRELHLMSKADAMGTCGLYVRYSFESGAPRVVEARRQDDCGGPRGTPDVTRWPLVRLKD